jgi:hypothetical protein
MDRAKTSSTLTKTLTVLQSLYAVQNTYCKRMESSPYVYSPNISLVGAILY